MFRKFFALSEQGDKDLKKGILTSTFANISLMLPVGLIILVLEKILSPLTGAKEQINIWYYMGLGLILLAAIYFTHIWQYRNTFVSAYSESANRRVSLAEKLRVLPLSFFGKKDLSELTTTMMGDCTDLEHTFSHCVPQLFGSCISLILVVLGLLMLNVKMALTVFLVVPLSFLIVFITRKIQDKYGMKKIKANLKVSDNIQEYLETVRDIRAYGKNEEYLEKMEDNLNECIRASIRSELITGVMVVSSQMLLRLGFPLVILVGANLLSSGEIDFMTYMIFLLAASRVYDPLSTVFMQLAELFNAQIKIKRMKDIEKQQVQEGTKEYNPKGYDIAFKNVVFSYNESEDVLKNVTFTAKQGEITALIGPSGGGKSTAAKLSARFWDIQSGRITVGGEDISKIEPETLLKSFSIVFQDVVLFNDTILNNIRLGKKDASDEEVYSAAKAAMCDEFIKRFKDGYNTVIGENGSTLSGGERQRISIARAILKDAPIVLLDEATASLDVENETSIQNALSKLLRNKTVLVIAHRMRTVAGADKIIALQNGNVAEEGSPSELMEKGKIYSHMVKLQAKTSNWSVG